VLEHDDDANVVASINPSTTAQLGAQICTGSGQKHPLCICCRDGVRRGAPCCRPAPARRPRRCCARGPPARCGWAWRRDRGTRAPASPGPTRPAPRPWRPPPGADPPHPRPAAQRPQHANLRLQPAAALQSVRSASAARTKHRTSLPTAQEACAAHSQPAAAASLPPSPAGCASPAGRFSAACTPAAPPAVHASSRCAGSPCAAPPRKASPATLAPPCAALAPGAAATRPRRAPVRASRMSASPLTRPTAAATAASSPGRTGGRLSRPAEGGTVRAALSACARRRWRRTCGRRQLGTRPPAARGPARPCRRTPALTPGPPSCMCKRVDTGGPHHRATTCGASALAASTTARQALKYNATPCKYVCCSISWRGSPTTWPRSVVTSSRSGVAGAACRLRFAMPQQQQRRSGRARTAQAQPVLLGLRWSALLYKLLRTS